MVEPFFLLETLIYGANKTILCVPEFGVLGMIGAHEGWSCASNKTIQYVWEVISPLKALLMHF